jgi:ABC-type multidrug transport system permease subunit
MNSMKRIWHIAFIDIRLMVRDKIFFFWTLLFPLVFIFIFGNLYKNDGSERAKASLLILNQDKGKWGAYFIEKLKTPQIALRVVTQEPEKYNRILVLPEDFSQKLAAKEAQQLLFKKREGANVNAAMQTEVKIIQGMVRLVTEMILHPNSETFFDADRTFKDIIQVKSSFPAGTITKIPSGFDHVIPGTMTQFILMMVLIYGGISVMMDRRRGTLLRMLFSATTIAQMFSGKFLARLMMGLIQAFILIITGKLFFNLNLGNNFLSLLTIIFFSTAIASLSIFVGSVIKKEDLLIGVSILLANIFAALGGCWWPLEVVPQTFRTIAMISPAYWAMDAFHQIIFFNKGLDEILVNFIVLLSFATLFTLLAIKYFKIRE